MKKLKIKDVIYLSIIGALVIALVFVSVNLILKTNKNAEYYDNKCQSFAVQNANLSKNQIVFIGDSITDLYPLDDYYSDLSLATYNRGIGGDVTTGVYDRLKVSAYDLAPTKIVLMIGINDINGGKTVQTTFNDYKKVVNDIYKNLPTVELFLMSVIPENDDLESYTTIKIDNTTPKIIELNTKIQALATEKGATYIDLFSSLKDENNHLIKTYSDDGIHLNANGFEVWTSLLKPYLI